MTARAPERALSRRYVEGAGRYGRDIVDLHAFHAVIIRSPLAHATIRNIDLDAARVAPGVRLAFCAADVNPHLDPMPPVWNLPGEQYFASYPLARGKATYVGAPLAVIVAETLDQAEDAARLVRLDLEALPPVLDIEASRAAAPIHEGWRDNVVATASWKIGDVEAALAGSKIFVEESFHSGRVIPLPLEARIVEAGYDPAGPSLKVTTSTQSIHQVRETIAAALRWPEHRIRVIAPDIGGAFGQKSCAYGEEVLVAWLAQHLRHRVHWAETRRESFVSSVSGRDERISLGIGFDGEGCIMALRARVDLDKGAEPYATSLGTAWSGSMMLTGPYKVPAVDIEARAHLTNKTPTGAYRGFGQPEANFALESVMDIAARRLGLAPEEIRRRNFVPSDAMPAMAPTGLVLDSGRYAELLDMALAHPARRRMTSETEAARKGGKTAGIGLSFFAEVSNFGPSALAAMVGVTQGGFEMSTVRMDASGRVQLFMGQTAMGQGLEHALALDAAAMLGLDPADVTVIYGDTESSAYTAYGSGGSRGAGVGGSAAGLATQRLAEKLKTIGAFALGADDVELQQGGVQSRGDPSKRIPVAEIARTAYRGAPLPDGVEPGLETQAGYDPPGFAVSYGLCMAQVEMDRATGRIDVKRLLFGHDCGRQLAPALVREQLMGGIAQALGATLYEAFEYDGNGIPISTAVIDYLVPLAADMPPVDLFHLETPSPFAANGAKGVGESGTIPVAAAIANALRDALAGDAPGLHALPIRPWTLA